MKYRKCIVCKKWGSFGVPVQYGNYEFYCGEHYFEQNKKNILKKKLVKVIKNVLKNVKK